MSPDGRWISYTTDKDGAEEVYLVEAAAVLPPPGQSAVPAGRMRSPSVQRVSPNGGTQAMWRADHKRQELYYRSADRHLMAVPVTEAGPGLPVPLFEIRTPQATPSYAPSPDGLHFLILIRVDDSPAVTVVMNWAEALRRPR